MRFSAPSACEDHRVGILSGFQPGRPPSSAFLRPLRVSSSVTPAALFHAADALGVFASSELFPLGWLYQARHLAIPSRRLLHTDPKIVMAASSGLCAVRKSVPVARLLQPAPGRCSLEVSIVFTAFVALGWVVLTATIRSWPFVSEAFKLTFDVGLQRLPTSAPASLALASTSRLDVHGLLFRS